LKKIYLAIPYTGQEKKSFKIANRIAGQLMNDGNIVFSPISHTHPIAIECGLPKEWEYWKDFDEIFIDWCDEIYIVTLDNWQKSKGVMAEIDIANKKRKPIKYINL
jgi:hypothetical protein